MNAAKTTLADAKSLLLAIAQDWEKLADSQAVGIERKGIHHHMVWAISELAGLFSQLEKEMAGAK